uniref:Uncharacterized protein n=1 Tax=Anguilla anguilla TaxID=7936 RepID=A0A0E9TP25_ANGAN
MCCESAFKHCPLSPGGLGNSYSPGFPGKMCILVHRCCRLNQSCQRHPPTGDSLFL